MLARLGHPCGTPAPTSASHRSSPGLSEPAGRLTKYPAWTRVAYSASEQDRLIERVFAFLLSPTSIIGTVHTSGNVRGTVLLVRGYINALAASMKHPECREEKEVRLIVSLSSKRSPLHPATARGVVPYVRVMATTDPFLRATRYFRPLPIREVRVGSPDGASEAQRIAGVSSLLAANGYEGRVPVNGSGIPFLP